MTDTSKKLLLIVDYRSDASKDLATFEVVQRLHTEAAKQGITLAIDVAGVDAFDVAQTAVLVDKAARSGQYDLVYHNTAPRLDGKPKKGNVGEGLAFADLTLDGGKKVQVVGVASGNAEHGNSFSLIQKHFPAVELKDIEFGHGNTQFRSRDLFPQEVLRLAAGDTSRLRQTIHVDEISDDAVTKATAELGGKLRRLHDKRVVHHGNPKRAYITVIAPAELAADIARRVHEANPRAEVDVLPLQSTTAEHRQIEAGFLSAQLAANNDARAIPNRAVVAVPTLEAYNALFHQSQPAYYAALDNGARLIAGDLATLAVPAKPVTADGQSLIETLSPLPWFAGLLFGSDFNLHVLHQAELANSIPSIKPGTVGYVDGYGNVKLAHFREELQAAGNLLVRNPESESRFAISDPTAESFAKTLGDHNLSRGSSGWRGLGFAELWVRLNDKNQPSAADKLGSPEPGQKLEFERGLTLLAQEAATTLPVAAAL